MASYTEINAQTVAELVAQSPTYARQILWVSSIAFDNERYNPFSELMGGLGSVKPVKEVLDTSAPEALPHAETVEGAELTHTAKYNALRAAGKYAEAGEYRKAHKSEIFKGE